jgi:hypothetical protein
MIDYAISMHSITAYHRYLSGEFLEVDISSAFTIADHDR